jgi:biotin carboxylase
MAEQCVLVVGGRPQLVRKARELGLRVVVVQQVDEFEPELTGLVDSAILVDYTDLALLCPLAVAAHEVFGFCAAVSTTEPGLEPAGRINDLLGLDGISYEASRLLRDKWAMREHLTSAGADTIAAELVSDRDSLLSFGRSNGFPFVVKPVDAAASLGVTLVHGEPDVDRVWGEIGALRGSTGHKFANYFPIDRFLMEEYVEGPEYSVESFSFGDRHVIVAITEKKTHADFVELGHALPARLDPSVEQEIVGLVAEFLDVMGLCHGPGHTEVKLSPAGPRVIESHNRTGGDRIPELVYAAYGIDLDAYTVAWPAKVWPALTGRPRARAAAATRFLVSQPGTVVRVDGVADMRKQECVLDLDVSVSAGNTVRPLRASWDRVGQVLVTGSDTGAAVMVAEQIAQKITIVTE